MGLMPPIPDHIRIPIATPPIPVHTAAPTVTYLAPNVMNPPSVPLVHHNYTAPPSPPMQEVTPASPSWRYPAVAHEPVTMVPVHPQYPSHPVYGPPVVPVYVGPEPLVPVVPLMYDHGYDFETRAYANPAPFSPYPNMVVETVAYGPQQYMFDPNRRTTAREGVREFFQNLIP
jgi:hypothetical protein